MTASDALSATSGLIATASSLDGVRVWSPDGDLVASVPTRQEDAPTLVFAPGTDTLYYEDGDGIVRRFPIDVDAVTELARSVLIRGLADNVAAYETSKGALTLGLDNPLPKRLVKKLVEMRMWELDLAP